MHEFDFLTHEKLGERLYAVHEDFSGDGHSFTIYVVTGDDKTGIFDSGFGVTSGLRRYIEENITDKKPMVCYATHVDLDHIGGAYLFDEIYMNDRELPKLEWNLNVERRFSDLKVFTNSNQEIIDFCREHYIHNEDLKTKNIDDGDVIDLGGVKLEVIAISGHTPGSVVYYNREQNYAVMGDAITPSTSLQRCRDLEKAMKEYERFIDMVPEDIVLYSNHGNEAQGIQDCKGIAQALKEILDGDTKEDIPFKLMFEFVDPEELTYDTYQHRCGNYIVPYDRNVVPKKGEKENG